MTKLEQFNFLGLDKLNALDRLNVLLPEFQITGSVSLFEYGVIKREISDIDIVVPHFDLVYRCICPKVKGVELWFDYTDKLQPNADSTEQPKGKIPNRASFNLDGVDVCIFYGIGQEFKFCEYVVNRRFKVSHPRYSVDAKLKYLKDLAEIELRMPLTDFQKQKKAKYLSDVNNFNVRFPDEKVSVAVTPEGLLPIF